MVKKKVFSPIISSAKKIYYDRYKDDDLSFDDFYTLSQQQCYYCGIKPKQKYNKFLSSSESSENSRSNGTFIYNGLDRVDSNLPHTKSNLVPCCKFCNYAKHNKTIKEFKEWVILVYKNWASK
jgi:hypothetical protein